MDTSTEQEIASGLQRGERQAWQKLYEAYAEPLWKNITRLVGNDSIIVADTLQETFLAAARSAKVFNPHRGSLRGWLWTIARRQVALYYRKQKSSSGLSRARQWWTALDGEKLDWIDAKADIPPDILQSQELATLVRTVLRELPGDYQTLLLAKYVDNLPVEKIAGQMNCSQIAIRSKLARARKSFRKAFEKIINKTSGSREVML
ncbi:MAG: RNA polymerase sigma factor [Sedimentisphaerales bacterium]|nr:RNA polymerase sigma factor [Sedimentisphaerales bacterium]